MNDYRKEQLIAAGREVIRTEKILRANPHSWAACHPDPDTPEGKAYKEQSDAYRKAESEFWMLTDCEFDDQDPLRSACWYWRYGKVMARTCTWHMQKYWTTNHASFLMGELQAAETKLMKELGLLDEYKSPNEYIVERFPNLKKE